MQLVQHKKEAYWFYYFLSNFYDDLVNPLFWTVKMRDKSLDLAQLNRRDLQVVDVGSGTGFTTQGIVEKVNAKNVTCIDQSHGQMSKAKKKTDLQDCTFLIGDAENLPFNNDHFDRYVSAGSIEYWPNPQRGLTEAFRVIKPGGTALMIGPLEPSNPIVRFFAQTWMLFPPREDYFKWMENAGFTNIRHEYVRPHWYNPHTGEYSIAIAGDKPLDAINPPRPAITEISEASNEEMSFGRKILMWVRVIAGSIAGFIFIPIALVGYLISIGTQKGVQPRWRETLTRQQVLVLGILAIVIVLLIIRCVV